MRGPRAPTARRVAAAETLWRQGHRIGLACVPQRGGALPVTLYRYRLPRGLRWAGGPGRLEVPLDRVTTATGFSYALHGWHPHVETLRRLADGDDPDRTPLGRLYAAFHPRTVQEAVCDDRRDPIPGLHDVPLVRGQLRDLWNPHGPRRARSAGELDRPGLYWGPASPAHVAAEIDRTLTVLRSMRRDGVRDDGPGRHAITGYLLVRGDDYRFVLHEGHHRVAALAALHHERAGVYLSIRHPPVVAEHALDRWTSGRRPRYTPATAQLLFTRIFESTGYEKAARLGLLDRGAARPGGA